MIGARTISATTFGATRVTAIQVRALFSRVFPQGNITLPARLNIEYVVTAVDLV